MTYVGLDYDVEEDEVRVNSSESSENSTVDANHSEERDKSSWCVKFIRKNVCT